MANHVSSLTEQQVLEIVRNNYESLILKLEDNLDQYDRYAERPYETQFFTIMVSRRAYRVQFTCDLYVDSANIRIFRLILFERCVEL